MNRRTILQLIGLGIVALIFESAGDTFLWADHVEVGRFFHAFGGWTIFIAGRIYQKGRSRG